MRRRGSAGEREGEEGFLREAVVVRGTWGSKEKRKKEGMVAGTAGYLDQQVLQSPSRWAMGEFSEAHLGSAAAQKGSVGGRGCGHAGVDRSHKSLRGHPAGALAGCWAVGALTSGRRAGPGNPFPSAL